MKPNSKPTVIKPIFALISLLTLPAFSTQAVDRFWSGGTSTYNNAASWGGTIPNGSDNAIVNNGGTVLINPGDPNWTTFDLRAGQAGGNGAYIQDGPTVTLNSWFRLAVDPGTTGTFTLQSGILNASPAFHVAEKGTGVLNINGGTINHLGTDAVIIGDRGSGSATAFGTINHAGGTFNSSSEMWIGQGGAFGGSQAGAYNLSGTGVLNVNNWLAVGRANANGVLSITNGTITKAGGGNIVIGGLAGNGTVNQYGGTVNNTGTGTWFGENAGGQGTWNLSGGTANLSVIQLSISGGGSGDGTFNLSGTGLLIATEIRNGGIGSSILNLDGGTLRAGADNVNFMHDLTAANVLAGGATIDSASHNLTISQALSDGGGGGGLTKISNGTLTLTGANSYTGPTIVKGGKLIAGTASLVFSDVTVSNNAGFGVLVAAANGQLSPANVTLASSATTLDFNLGGFGNPSLAPLNVTGVLNANGTVTVNVVDALPQVGQFSLVKYGSKTGSGTFVLGTLPVGVSATLVNNTGNNSIDLNISSTALIRWDGEVVGGVWDINTTTNWTGFATALPAKYTEGAAVYFDDLALGTTTVNLGVTVNPGTVIVTNDTLPYSLTGSGKLNGATGFTKQGSNSFTIANTTGNTYTGPTVISGGTLNVTSLANGGLPSAIGGSSANSANLVFDGGTLSYAGPATTIDRGYSVTRSSALDLQNDLTVNGILAPSVGANFLKSGPGTLSYLRAGANTLSLGGGGGAYVVGGGKLVLDGTIGGQTNSITGELYLGNTTAGGALALTNTTLNISSWFAIARGTGTGGYASSAVLHNSALRTGNLSLAYDNGIAGTLQTALLTLNNGSTLTNTGDSNIGESSGGMAAITLNDSSIFFSNNRAMIGWNNSATGMVTIANSAKIVVNAWMSIGNEGGVGSVLVKDNGALIMPGGSSDLNICDVNGGQGDLTITNNAQVRANNLFVGKGAGSAGTLTQAGGTVASATGGGINVIFGNGSGSTGTANLNGGTLVARQISGIGGTTTLNFNGGVLQAGAGAVANFMAGLTTANIQAPGAVIDSSTNRISIAQSLQGDPAGDGGLTKIGNGTLFLDGFNTYTNVTTVSFGSLGGNGTVSGPLSVQSGAALAPGNGLGTLTVNNNLKLAGNLLIDVDKSQVQSNDLTVVTGTLSNIGTGTVKVSNLGPTLTVGDSFTLFSQPVVNGNTLTVLPSGGAIWTNKLAFDGSIQVIGLVPPPTFSPGTVTHLPDGNISLAATGTVGGTYKLWASTNVALTPITNTWTLLNSGTITVSPFTINDLTATNFSQRFYIFSTP
jgi:autotransporter-associated beta strand protein